MMTRTWSIQAHDAYEIPTGRAATTGVGERVISQMHSYTNNQGCINGDSKKIPQIMDGGYKLIPSQSNEERN